MSRHNIDVPIGRDAQTATSTGGGSIGCGVKDASEDAACTRDAHGLTEPESPALSPPRTAREFDKAMRALGYSKRQAAAIASHGFKGFASAEPPEDSSADLERLAAALRGTVNT